MNEAACTKALDMLFRPYHDDDRDDRYDAEDEITSRLVHEAETKSVEELVEERSGLYAQIGNIHDDSWQYERLMRKIRIIDNELASRGAE